jgi:hypothetical protein
VYIENHPVDLILSGSSVFVERMRGREKRLVEVTTGLWIYVVIRKSMLFDVDCFEGRKGW